jgi:hypothetical protein
MSGAEIKRHSEERIILAGDITDDDLEAAGDADGKSASVTHMACTSLPECPGERR